MIQHACSIDDEQQSINFSDDEFYLLYAPGNNLFGSEVSFLESILSNQRSSVCLKESPEVPDGNRSTQEVRLSIKERKNFIEKLENDWKDMLGLQDEEYGDTVLLRMPNNEFCNEPFIIPINAESILTSNYYRQSIGRRQRSVQESLMASSYNRATGNEHLEKQLQLAYKNHYHRNATGHYKSRGPDTYQQSVVVSECSEYFFSVKRKRLSSLKFKAQTLEKNNTEERGEGSVLSRKSNNFKNTLVTDDAGQMFRVIQRLDSNSILLKKVKS